MKAFEQSQWQAAAYFQQAIEIQPNFPEAYNARGTALIRLGKLQAAIIEFQKAVQFRPDYPEARANLIAASAQDSLKENSSHSPKKPQANEPFQLFKNR